MKTRVLLTLPAATLILAACAQPGDPNQRTKNGAIIGAAIGGALGANSTSDNKLERGVIGAALGGAVGAAIGNSLDQQAQELRRDLDGNIGVVNTDTELRVTMPQDLLFAVDSVSLRPALQDDLRVLAQSLKEYPDTNVFVVGHTDSTGAPAYNQGLSERRASTVSSILNANGVRADRLRISGAGETQPIASNATADGRAQNRRVEIIIRPKA